MRPIRFALPALALTGALALAGCGGGSSGSSAAPITTATTAAPADTATTAPADTGSTAPAGARLSDPAVQKCLADKGVTLPQRGQGGAPGTGATGGGPPSSMDANTRQALQDCGVTFGGGAGGAGGGAGRGRNDPALTQCLAGKGITLPAFGGRGGGGNGGQGASSTQATTQPTTPPSTIDAATQQAIQDCRAQEAATSTTTTG